LGNAGSALRQASPGPPASPDRLFHRPGLQVVAQHRRWSIVTAIVSGAILTTELGFAVSPWFVRWWSIQRLKLRITSDIPYVTALPVDVEPPCYPIKCVERLRPAFGVQAFGHCDDCGLQPDKADASSVGHAPKSQDRSCPADSLMFGICSSLRTECCFCAGWGQTSRRILAYHRLLSAIYQEPVIVLTAQPT
jgi:hypothetical protein